MAKKDKVVDPMEKMNKYDFGKNKKVPGLGDCTDKPKKMDFKKKKKSFAQALIS